MTIFSLNCHEFQGFLAFQCNKWINVCMGIQWFLICEKNVKNRKETYTNVFEDTQDKAVYKKFNELLQVSEINTKGALVAPL